MLFPERLLMFKTTKKLLSSQDYTISYLWKCYQPGSLLVDRARSLEKRHLLSFMSCHQMAATVGGGDDDFLLCRYQLISSGSCGYSLLLLLLLSHLWSLVNPWKTTAVSSMSFCTIKGAWESVPNCGPEEAALNNFATPHFFLPLRGGRYRVTFHFKPSGKLHILNFKHMTLKIIGPAASGAALVAACAWLLIHWCCRSWGAVVCGTTASQHPNSPATKDLQLKTPGALHSSLGWSCPGPQPGKYWIKQIWVWNISMFLCVQI